MKLSSKGRYAIMALYDMASHGTEAAIRVKEICDRQEIPARFLEQVFQDLKRAAIVRSKRGPRGGYQLHRSAEQVTLGDIIRAVEGPVSLAQPSSGKPPTGGAQVDALAVVQDILSDAARRIDACLDETTLADIVERGKAMGVDSGRASAYVYAI